MADIFREFVSENWRRVDKGFAVELEREDETRCRDRERCDKEQV